MTENQRMLVSTLRQNGLGYGTIARRTGISVNTIKSFCRRRKETPAVEKPDAGMHFCLSCGVPVAQNPGRKEKKFCSDKCRNQWWNAHLHLVHRRAFRDVVCLNCGKPFVVYGKAERKYCCHQCYIEDRFGRDYYEQEATPQ